MPAKIGETFALRRPITGRVFPEGCIVGRTLLAKSVVSASFPGTEILFSKSRLHDPVPGSPTGCLQHLRSLGCPAQRRGDQQALRRKPGRNQFNQRGILKQRGHVRAPVDSAFIDFSRGVAQ